MFRKELTGSWGRVGGDEVAATILRHMAFSGTRGVAVGEGGSLFETRNAGLTWVRKRSWTEQTLLAAAWSKNGLPIAVGTRGVVVRRGLPQLCGMSHGDVGTSMWP